MALIFADAAKVRDAITESQKKEIAQLYNDWADDIGDRANYYKHKTTSSSWVSEQQMKELQKQLRATSEQVSNEVYKKVKGNMYTVADSMVQSNAKWLKQFGFEEKGINIAFSSVPDSVVRNIVTGNIYDSGWSLSDRIWGNNEDTLKDIYQVVAKGIAENRPIYDIAKNLEAYVRPGAKLPWNLEAGDGVKIFKKQVDYNAQRLARTLVQHSYQQSFIATTKDNPFITDYVWISNGSRVCPLCIERNGKHFKKDELPMDHPNGMCTMEPAVVDDMIDQLADWINSDDGTFPEIDKFAKNFNYKIDLLKPGTSEFTNKVNDIVGKYGQASTSINSWLNKMSPEDKVALRELRSKSGLKWDDFYKQYVGGNLPEANNFKGIDTKWFQTNMSKLRALSTKQLTEKKIDDIMFKEMENCKDEKLLNAFAKATKNLKSISNNVDEGGAFYMDAEKRINISFKGIMRQSSNKSIETKLHTFYHESGHCIDYNLVSGKRLSTDKNYLYAMRTDLKNMFGSDPKISKEELVKIFADNNSRGIQDIASGALASGKYNVTVRPNWSHSKDYWLRSNVDKEMASELFAHLTASKFSPIQTEYMKKCFPNALKKFDKLIESGLK